MQIPTAYQQYYQQHHFQQLTPIQAQVYEPLRQGESILSLAPTGSGKTLAFGMPLLERVQAGGGIQGLILEPSQELAIQTRNVLRELNPQLNVYSVIGGANVRRQIEHLKQKPEVVIGTIGRIQDLVEKRKFKLNKIQTVIIDEADVLLSDKLTTVRALLSRLQGQFQLGLFSATSADIFSQLSRWFPQQIQTIDLRQDAQFRAGLQHYFLLTANNQKVNVLQKLAHRKNKQNLVFYQSSKELHRYAADMRYRKTYFTVLDTSDPKKRRADALNDLRTRETSLLLTTDVAARGMDLPQLTTVINWNNPQDLTEYIHRSGRTGRMGRTGEVITLGNEHDFRALQELVQPQKIKLHKVRLQGDQLVSVAQKTAPASIKKKSTARDKHRQRHQKQKGYHGQAK
ncbi:DEAD/DEAH box helicase [Bombilactobacillus folatiphilus]|uniref:DEAD/DEAH box helicase n=1 Tax=Bombilactobacillus folatiphilus TaxID=2923362 RepID=A0ABY4P8B2_9LACO|nr:DEAD/DEAH box helicase [Bombilactobacillus folatiphilus]UQS81771.1 DEAD/DEAH box helicase [Bombilactobacillus folatiphilus]